MLYIMEEYEISHLLPKIKGVSGKQETYGRSCRFRYLSQATQVYNSLNEADQKKLILWLKEIKMNVNPHFWITQLNGNMADDWKKKVDTLIAAAKKVAKINRNEYKKKVYIPPDKTAKWKPDTKPKATGWKLSISSKYKD